MEGYRLKTHPLFEDLTDDQLDLVASHMEVAIFKKGSHVVTEGLTASDMFFIISGRGECIKNAGGEIVLEEVGPGSFFGVMTVIFGRTRSYSVVARTNIRSATLSKADFEELKTKIPELTHKVEQIAKVRFAEFKQKLSAITLNEEINSEDAEQFRAIFNDIDSDGNGYLDIDEFRFFLSRLARKTTLLEEDVLWDNVDKDNDGRVTFEEFIAGLSHFSWVLHK